ncbi:hypothetical protein AY604_20860 [Salmonella enterica subsp. enterica]|nr:hypothetical protein AY604_20860 [Salmonella enterica subsp. enterica]
MTESAEKNFPAYSHLPLVIAANYSDLLKSWPCARIFFRTLFRAKQHKHLRNIFLRLPFLSP